MLKAGSFEKVVPLLAGLVIGTATLGAEQSFETPPMLEAELAELGWSVRQQIDLTEKLREHFTQPVEQ